MINRSERCREEVFVLCIQENLSNIEIPFFFSISGGLQIFFPWVRRVLSLFLFSAASNLEFRIYMTC